MSPWASTELRGKGAAITFSFFTWCAVGALAGWLFGALMQSRGRIQRLEEVLVGVFGSFIGAESTAAMLAQGENATGVQPGALAGAVIGATVLLVLLRIMRGAVGPLRSSKSPAARRR
jgi:uncharacterized membrane protein YeaQ/YmgE (transglycosylase-associated protein family)